MKVFEVWVDFYEGNRTKSTDILEVHALTAKIAMFHALTFLNASVPDGLGVEEITVICQEKESEEDEE